MFTVDRALNVALGVEPSAGLFQLIVATKFAVAVRMRVAEHDDKNRVTFSHRQWKGAAPENRRQISV